MDTETAHLVLEDVNRAHHTRFALVRPLRGGHQSGTWLLRDAGGEPASAVLKWSPDRAWAPQVLRAGEVVERARAVGYPTPAWIAAGVSGPGFPYHVQQFVPGAVADRLTAAVAERLVPVLEKQRGLDIDPRRCWSRHVRERIAGEWEALRDAVAAADPGGRRFVTALDALLAGFGDVALPTGDLVHGDFRLANVLFRAGRVAAVIDMEALGSGTRAYDYATLLTVDDIDPAGWELIRAAGERVAGPGVLAHCFALAALDLADFVRRHVPARLPHLIGPLTSRAESLLP